MVCCSTCAKVLWPGKGATAADCCSQARHKRSAAATCLQHTATIFPIQGNLVSMQPAGSQAAAIFWMNSSCRLVAAVSSWCFFEGEWGILSDLCLTPSRWILLEDQGALRLGGSHLAPICLLEAKLCEMNHAACFLCVQATQSCSSAWVATWASSCRTSTICTCTSPWARLQWLRLLSHAQRWACTPAMGCMRCMLADCHVAVA